MAWGGIPFHARTELVFIQNGTLNAHRYLTVILEDHVVPFMGILGEEPTFMHDNARLHPARLVSAYLARFILRDLCGLLAAQIQIEHVWDEMGKRLRPPEILESF
nr:unnamed protein product [Callosobruchus chinensis]